MYLFKKYKQIKFERKYSPVVSLRIAAINNKQGKGRSEKLVVRASNIPTA